MEQRKDKDGALDYGLLFGNENDKTFFGLKTGCYFETIKDLKEKERDKDVIKNYSILSDNYIFINKSFNLNEQRNRPFNKFVFCSASFLCFFISCKY